MFEVIKPFHDAEDNGFRYIPGDKYPRSGFEVSESRLEELSTANNRVGYPVIKNIEEEPKVAEMASGEPKKTDEEVEEIPDEVKEEPKPVPKPKRGRKKKNAD